MRVHDLVSEPGWFPDESFARVMGALYHAYPGAVKRPPARLQYPSKQVGIGGDEVVGVNLDFANKVAVHRLVSITMASLTAYPTGPTEKSND
jgi:hypothetical protein